MAADSPVFEAQTGPTLAYGGDAVARLDGLVVFVRGALPGERVRARLVERRKDYARAELVEVLEASSDRREPRCPHFGRCGGCQLQHFAYAAQLAAKQGFLRDALRRVAHLDWPQEIPVHQGPEYGYRPRARLQVKETVRGPVVGFFEHQSRRVCPIEVCPVLVPELEAALPRLREQAIEAAEPDGLEVAAGEVAEGGELRATIGGRTYALSADTFFQGNAFLVESLCRAVTEGQRGAVGWDLYSGVGLFAAALAPSFEAVVAVESNERAAELCRRNLAADAAKSRVVTADVAAWLNEATGGEPTPDLVVLDPPRIGAAAAVPHLVRIGAPRLVYVSCDPPTLARDLRHLVAGGYALERLEIFDLFPQTYHVETVAWLAKR